MNILLLPAVTTIIFIFFCLDKRERYRIAYIILFFFFMLGLNYFCHADEKCNDVRFSNIMKNEELTYFQEFLCFPDHPLSEETKKYIWESKERKWEHFLLMMRAIDKEEQYFFYKNYSCRDAVHDAIKAVIAATQTKSITSAAILALSVFLESALEKWYDEWLNFKYKVNWAQHDLEMYEFFDDILLKNAQMFGEDKYDGPK